MRSRPQRRSPPIRSDCSATSSRNWRKRKERAGAPRRRRKPQLPRAGRTRQSLCPLGARSKPRQRRNRLPDDAEPAGIYSDLAWPHQRRRRRCADQHPAARALARALHRYRGAAAHDRRRGICRRFATRPRSSDRPKNLDARRRQRRRMRAHRLRRRAIFGRAADRRAAPPGNDRRSGVVDLHLRHDRPAEGRQCQPPAAAAMELLVRRADEYLARRPHVQLPADVSQRRRCRRHRRRPGARRLDADPRQILRSAFLGRYRRRRMHAVPIYRRTMPLSAQRARPSPPTRPSPAAMLRQRAPGRRVGKIPGQVRHSAHPGILRGDRRQCVALQCRRQSRRHRPHSALPGVTLPAGAGEIRRRGRTAGPRCRRLLHPLRDR